MTVRGCVLGNSHVACLRAAWEAGASSAFSLDFVAAHADKLDGLEIARGRAIARTEPLRETLKKLRMRRSFQLDEYDFFLIIGCQISIFRAVHASLAMAVWPEEPGDRPLVSAACFEAALADALRETTGWRLASLLRQGTEAPIFLLPTPRPHAAVLFPESRFAGFRRVSRDERGAWVAAAYERACAAAFDGLADVLHQPPDTVIRDLCTAPAYSEGSLMLAVAQRHQREGDLLHANAAYGQVQLAQISTALAAGAVGQVGAT